jgi:hypothetical protein
MNQDHRQECPDCKYLLHVKDCKGCGRSCLCHDTSHRVYEEGQLIQPGEPLTAGWEKNILKAFIARHGAENVREAVNKLEAQLG